MKTLAIGDIHCKPWIIDKVENIIDEYDKIVFVGDYADDFSATSQDRITIWRRMKTLSEKYNKVELVTGNHDYVYIKDELKGFYSGWDSTAQFLLDLDKDLKEWVENLPIYKVIDGVMYSHAGITKVWANSTTQEHFFMGEFGPLWVRPHFGYVYRPNQVFGHTPHQTCTEVQKNVWCIDTFSTHRDGTPIGDGTVLEIIDGKEFKKVKL